MIYPITIYERPPDDKYTQGYREYKWDPMKMLDSENIKEAIVPYGMHLAYVRQMLNTRSTQDKLTPKDWKQLGTAELEYGPQLEWNSWLREEAKALEQQEKSRGFEISQDQILGESIYADISSQATFDEHTLSLCHTEAVNALK